MTQQAISLIFHAATVRKAGRPRGAKAQVIRDPRALGIHHFAFVRASLWGLDLSQSFTRYLAWSETTTDLRYVQNRRDALLKQIIEAGRHLNASLPEAAKITSMLDLLREATRRPNPRSSCLRWRNGWNLKAWTPMSGVRLT